MDKEATKVILERAKVLAPDLVGGNGEMEVVSEQVGFRPSREGGPRVEVEAVEGRVVVHSYGHSGAGYVFSSAVCAGSIMADWGTLRYQNSVGSARKVVRLLEDNKNDLGRSEKL